jgi:hypothetical protein
MITIQSLKYYSQSYCTLKNYIKLPKQIQKLLASTGIITRGAGGGEHTKMNLETPKDVC